MVCAKCEKKLTKVAAPDKWKDGSRNSKGTDYRFYNFIVPLYFVLLNIPQITVGEGGRKLNENKLLSKSAKSR
jgi:cysteine-rich PDZ-binding protein